jgi:hypothetical protein
MRAGANPGRALSAFAGVDAAHRKRGQVQVAGRLGHTFDEEVLPELLRHVGQLHAFQTVGFDDVFVAQKGGDVGFVAQARFLLFVQGFQGFENDVVEHAAAVLLNEIDDAHAATAEFFHDGVVCRTAEAEASEGKLVQVTAPRLRGTIPNSRVSHIKCSRANVYALCNALIAQCYLANRPLVPA